jgi:nitrite reductase/ring-hydroxylating ferredoxin subunit
MPDEHPRADAFHQTWYPVALAAELGRDSLLGQDFLGSRVVVYRDPDGRPVVQSAWCPHLGADLSVGAVIDGRVRCAFHHRSYDAAGRCVPAGDMFMLFSGSAMARGKTMSYYAFGVRKGPGAEARLAGVASFGERLIAEDTPVLETIRFRKGVLVASDRHLARFLHYVETFPTAPPLD